MCFSESLVAPQLPAQQGRITSVEFKSGLFLEFHFPSALLVHLEKIWAIGVCVRPVLHANVHQKTKDFGHFERQDPSA